MSAYPLTGAAARPVTGRALASSAKAIVEPPFFSQVGLLLTLRCPVRCEHCMVQAGPHRTEEMEVERAHDWLEQIAACGARSIGFTGGEPFYCWEKLLALSQAARGMGLTYTVVTNAYWADSLEKAHERLAQLQPSEMSISTDIYHTRYVPL